MITKRRNTFWSVNVLLFTALLCSLIFIPQNASAAYNPVEGFLSTEPEGYEITGYRVDAVISEENVYDVTETINVHFSEQKSGFSRDIPVNTVMTRKSADGKLWSTFVESRIWDVSVEGREFSVDTFGIDMFYDNTPDRVSVDIGGLYDTFEGDQTFRISYKLGFGSDGVSDFDEAYYNIIGIGWNVPISNVTFSITLPKPFDADKLGFSTGWYSSEGYDPNVLKYEVKGNSITGSASTLDAGEGVTMRLELPEGYFHYPGFKQFEQVMMEVFGGIALFALLMFLLFGRRGTYVKTVEFYAPEGLTPAEIGFVTDGMADDEDVISLLVYWADKGYLSINEHNGKYELKKLKELGPEAKDYEKSMFRDLFWQRDTVALAELESRFHETVGNVKQMIKSSYEDRERRVFFKASLRMIPLFAFFSILPLTAVLALELYRLRFSIPGAIIISGAIGFCVLLPAALYFVRLIQRRLGENHRKRKMAVTLSVLAAICAAITALSAGRVYEPLLPFAALTAFAVVLVCAAFMKKHNARGTQLLGKIVGFRDFIMLAERERLQALAGENPSYFYNILPYAYVLGVSDIWISKFAGIAVEPPGWYHGQRALSPALFALNFNSAMTALQTHMTSAPSGRRGIGGGFSGGGFSGGGGGGGGGRAW